MARVYWSKVNPRAVMPTKREEDAGFDIYGLLPASYLILKPHQIYSFATGLKSAFSKSFCFMIKERGSTGTKGIQQRCGVIDSGFRGEWFIPVQNGNDVDIVFYDDTQISQSVLRAKLGIMHRDSIYHPMSKAICQAVFTRVPKVKCIEVDEPTLLKNVSQRMFGMKGSSGK